jgi:hypothetical protein
MPPLRLQEQPKNVTLSLVGEHGATLYGTLTFLGVEGGWRKYTAELASTATGEGLAALGC